MNDKSNKENFQVNNPLHGIRLIDILEYLVDDTVGKNWDTKSISIALRIIPL